MQNDNATVTSSLRDDSSAAVNLTRIKTNADPVKLAVLAVLANAGASFQDKRSAVEALSQIARRGDDKVINAITKLLQEGSGVIRYAAICALPKIVQQGHPPTIAALTVSLENDCHQNRGAAIGALVKLVQKGHRPTIDSLMTVLANDGDSSFVRTSAVEALSQIARRGDDKVINAITKLLQEGGSAIRYAAICALPKIVQQGHPTTIAALTVSLEDDCHQNRGAAIGALAKLVQQGYRPNCAERPCAHSGAQATQQAHRPSYRKTRGRKIGIEDKDPKMKCRLTLTANKAKTGRGRKRRISQQSLAGDIMHRTSKAPLRRQQH
jgi:hypothetical protein